MRQLRLHMVCTAMLIAMAADSQKTVAPVIFYTLAADAANLSEYGVTIHIQHARRTLLLAMATHHEYDDRYWRYVRSFSANTSKGAASFARPVSALWQIASTGGDITVNYRIQLPAKGQLCP